jgi:hypothetical protein
LGRELKQPTYYAIAEVAFAVKNNDVLSCCSFHDVRVVVKTACNITGNC